MSIIVVIQSLSCVQLFATPWTAACQVLSMSDSIFDIIYLKFILLVKLKFKCKFNLFNNNLIFNNGWI